jgi:3-deoxy-D-manno-octulosonic-acid transferase
VFSLFYYIIATIIYIVAIPFLIYKSKNQKYKDAIPARFFLKNNTPFNNKNIWFHVCSMGETRAIKPIIEALSQDVNISVITNTGYEEAKKITNNVKYLPFEIFLPFWIKPQKALVVVEAELWYMLFLVAFKQKTKTVLINARISDNSYNSYKKFKWFYKKIFNNIDIIFAQTQEDEQRLSKLGGKNIKVIGNIKLVTLPKITNELKKPQNTTIITAGSTHKGEEELILQAYDKSFGKLIIVPRHPERFNEVDELIKKFIYKKDITYHRYSQKQNFSSDIILVDKMGELNNIYTISDVVLLCGAFLPNIGGHNPIEPAFFNTKIISGEYYFNQKSLFECVKNIKVIKTNELKTTIKNIKNIPNASLVEIGSINPILNYLKEIK